MGVVLGIRLTSSRGANDEPDRESGVWLSVGGARPGASDARTFRLGEGAAFAEATLAFGRALARSLLRNEPTQRQHHRLTAFRSGLRSLDERLSEAKCDDVLVNPLPEIYRVGTGPRPAPADDRVASKLRFSPAWTTSFTGIDLRATFLCGEHLIVGASRETACVARRSGDVLWRRPTPSAVSVPTPVGFARLFADGSIALHDFRPGHVRMTTRRAPRPCRGVTGSRVT